MSLYSASGNLQTFTLTEADDTLSLGNYSGLLVQADATDTITGGLSASATFLADAGNDVYTLGDGAFTAEGLSSRDNFTAGDGTDTISLTGESAVLHLGDGDDIVSDTAGLHNAIVLGDGHDTITLHDFNILDGGIGSTAESETVSLFFADQVFLGDGNNTVISGGASSNTIFVGNGNNHITLGSTDTLTAGDGANQVSLESADIVTLGNGDNTVNIAANASNVMLTLGNGDNTVIGGNGVGNLTILAGTGDDVLDLEEMSGGFTFSQAAGAGVDTIDLNYGDFTSVNLTLTNPADVIYVGDDVIGHFTINLATDGFKLPDGDYEVLGYGSAPTANTVNYLDTNQVINAAYAQAVALPYFLADLLFSPAPHWNTALGDQATLTFSFMQAVPTYANSDDRTGFAALGGDLPAGLSPSQLLAENAGGSISLTAAESIALVALADWEAVADVTFVSAADSNSVELRIGSNDQGKGAGGYAYVPFPDATGNDLPEEGDIYLNNDTAANPQSDWAQVLIREVGHALGLGGGSGGSDPFDLLPGGKQGSGGGEDSALYTIMSNLNPPSGSSSAVTTPQVFDIALAQYLYGPDPGYDPNPSHVWTFSGTPYSTSATTAQNTANLILGGGDNTIAAGGWTGAGYIDLRPGHWSWLGAQSTNVLAADQLFIDYGSTVDTIDAELTSGSMTLVANADAHNAILCGAGNDLIVVGAGIDSITGGIGQDTVLFAGTEADYTITPDGNGVYTISSTDDGTVILSNVATLEFTDQTITGFEAIALGNLTTTQFMAMPTTGLAALAPAAFDSLTTTEIALFSTTQMHALTGSQLAGLTQSQLAALASSQFAAITPVALAALSTSMLQTLTTAQVAAITGTQLLNIPVAALAELTVTEVAELSTSQLAALNAAGMHGLGATNLDALTTTQLVSLSTSQLAGFTAAAIAGLNASQFAVLSTSQIAGLSRTQAAALTVTDLGVLTASQAGALSTAALAVLSAGQIESLGFAALAGFSASQVAALSTSAVAGLGQDQAYALSNQDIAALSTAQVQVLSVTQLMGFSANQLAAFTATQIRAMNTTQYALIFG